MFLMVFITLLKSICFAGILTSEGETKYTIGGEFGYYIPSLKKVNETLQVAKRDKINGGLSTSGKILFGGEDDYLYLGIGYWYGSSNNNSNNISYTTKVTLITPFFLGYGAVITVTPNTKLNIAIQGSYVIGLYSYSFKFSSSSGSYDAIGPIGYDLGIKVGGEYFIIPEVLSVGGNVGFVFLGSIPFLNVSKSTIQDVSVGQRLKNADGSDFSLELDGVSLVTAVNFYF